MWRPERARIFLVGEGEGELGSRAGAPAQQSDRRPGVLSTLLSRVQPSGWVIGGAREWRSIRKVQARGVLHEDTRNVLGAALDAQEAGCDVLVFSRDIDRDPARREAVEEGIRRVSSILSAPPEVIGGVAVPALAGWILALLGERATEELSPLRAQAMLAAKGMMPDDGAAMVRVAAGADLDAVPPDATSLTEWLARARAVLPRRTGRAAR
ncbi:hypothetical protein SOCEGT47_010400 [Sorangium cellulosum]|jgi:hypothetical protein|uniref:Uncharacterized protein n=1 Tax=Sorangium cellulosum TaxID=56 RepID=A0A4P2PVA5_SORCE|nr:hypothetical protein [Sorangium cellulosum]AUX20568.1 hypothetical protein SOCEGT47_010400 [Sorangium cellulosum]